MKRKQTQDNYIKELIHAVLLFWLSLIFFAGVGAMIVSEKAEQLLEYPLTFLMLVILSSLYLKLVKYKDVYFDYFA